MNDHEQPVDNKTSSTSIRFFTQSSSAAGVKSPQAAPSIAVKQASTTENAYDLLCATANMLNKLGTALVQLEARGSATKVDYVTVSQDIAATKLKVLQTPQGVEEELARQSPSSSPTL